MITANANRMLPAAILAGLALLYPIKASGQGGNNPEPDDAKIHLNTSPSGAIISCDSEIKGRSPLIISDLKPGKHLITARKDRYHDARRTVILESGQSLPLSLELEPVKALLLVHSDPGGSEIRIDGAYVGQTPAFLSSLPLGKYRMKIDKTGFAPKTVVLELDDRVPRQYNISLKSNSASVTVTSDPAGARVVLNNVQKGTTPVTIERAPVGENTIELQKEGFEAYKEQVKLQAGADNRVTAKLTPIPAELKVVSLPPDARIYFRNERAGLAPVTLRDLEPGQYRVRAELEGYAPLSRTVSLNHGETKTEEFRLSKNSGTVLITTQPSNVKVSIDGEPAGTTKLDIQADIDKSEPLRIERVTAGKHRVTLKKKGYHDLSFEIDVTKEKTLDIKKELKKHFVENYVVQTETATYRGMLIEISRQGAVKLEVRPGTIMTFPADKIVVRRPITPEDTD
jgi:hypothetical protein